MFGKRSTHKQMEFVAVNEFGGIKQSSNRLHDFYGAIHSPLNARRLISCRDGQLFGELGSRALLFEPHAG